MKGEDGRAPPRGSCRALWMAMQTWKRRTGAGMVCVPPLVYLWDPREVDPPAVSRPRKFENSQKKIKIYTNANNTTVLRPTFPNLRQSSTVHCSTCARSPYY